ncbi:DUF6428 family protein [Hydrogenovibrio sp. 3SP14C1]|nr:DUF6428 family protein [Hydrogenovibrio sp. 3SP14C1]
MFFTEFQRILKEHSSKRLKFVLPDGNSVPEHFHITDVGSVFRHFIDCGGQLREESYVQIQLWLGADKEHRITSETATKILQQSQPVLNKIQQLESCEVMIEYQTMLTALYSIREMKNTEAEIIFFLEATKTQCLAALRHEQEKKQGYESSCCSKDSCCG